MQPKGRAAVSQWDKLIADILREDAHLRFEDLCKALEKMGYTAHQPRSGSSHYTFRKADHMPITIPRHQPLNKAYIAMVADIVRTYKANEEETGHE